MLSKESSSEPGRWQTSRAPYQREIMDSFTTPGVKRVVVKSACQIGKSDIMNNVIGRFAHVDPCPIIMIQPTVDTAQDYSKSRIAPMIRDTKCLNELFYDEQAEAKSRDSSNTILSKSFPGGRLIMVGANSPSGLASKIARIVLADEVDRFPVSAGTEGDPLGLVEGRTTTYWNSIIGVFSTPTNKGASKIDNEYEKGTQEEWQHKCPNCGEYHLLRYKDFETESNDRMANGERIAEVISVRWRCPDCGFLFSEKDMHNAEQKYIPQNPEALKQGVRSFFINGFTSPWIGWKKIMTEWLQARGTASKEKVVSNLRFGESYEGLGEYDNEDVYLNRREEYEAELPQGSLLLTAAVDTQDNRLEYEICAWGVGEECWGIKKGIILGIPDDKKVWAALDMRLDKVYRFRDGRGLKVARTFIDSGGHYTSEVYDYCRSRIYAQRFAIKGASQYGVPIIHKFTKAGSPPIPVILIGTDSGKQYVMERLNKKEPGAKYFHFPSNSGRGYDETYFKGLTSEKIVPQIRNGQTVLRWQKKTENARNEPLDLRVYNLACLRTLDPIDWDKMQEVVEGNGGIASPSDPTKQHTPRAQGNRKRRSSRGANLW